MKKIKGSRRGRPRAGEVRSQRKLKDMDRVTHALALALPQVGGDEAKTAKLRDLLGRMPEYALDQMVDLLFYSP